MSILTETRLSLKELADREGVALSTVWRWTLVGVSNHCLESYRVGGRKFTSVQAFQRWMAKVNPPQELATT